jgi:hypothetical protein
MMRPPNCPDFAWVRASECAVANGIGDTSLWKWSRQERTKVLLASLDSLPRDQAMYEEVTALVYQRAYEAALDVAIPLWRKRRER